MWCAAGVSSVLICSHKKGRFLDIPLNLNIGLMSTQLGYIVKNLVKSKTNKIFKKVSSNLVVFRLDAWRMMVCIM